LPDEFLEPFESVRLEAERLEIKTAVLRVEQPDDNFFPANGGENGNAQFHIAEFGARRDAAFLRQLRLVGDQIRHDLEAARNAVEKLVRQMSEFPQCARDAQPDGKGAFPWLDMNIARLVMNGVKDDVVDENRDVDLLERLDGPDVRRGQIHGCGIGNRSSSRGHLLFGVCHNSMKMSSYGLA
jgi:hypothetical protein